MRERYPMDSSKIASVHIPKTGGTTLRDFYSRTYGVDNVLRYSVETDKFHRLSDDGILSRRTIPAYYHVRNILIATRAGRYMYNKIRSHDNYKADTNGYSELPFDFKVVHGHFRPSRINDHLDEVRLVTVVREPLERALSGYFFLKKVENAAAQNGTLPDWYTRGMKLDDFLFLPEMTNYQSKFLEGLDNRFDTIGTTDELECFCRRIEPESEISLRVLNTTKRPEYYLSERNRREFLDRNKEDYDLYNYAKSMTV